MNAVITGGSKGIGKAIAEKLASLSYNLFITSRNEAEIIEVADTLTEKYQIKVHYHSSDLSIKLEALQTAQIIKDKLGRIDVLVNNAGRFIPGQIQDEADGILEAMINTNLYSAYHLTRGLLPVIDENSHIFNMCSIASKIAYPNGGSYSISKFALLGFSKVLREELKEKKIKVTAILPGATWSDSWKGVDLPYDRLMEAKDVAEIVASCLNMSHAACVEEILLRPQLGDL